ncbi:bucentaur or craniofacial development-domain-containing protein [Mariannaea sp. PMI_226]|nr:bucentaur or craniofacial development-domain-containing protein [Mariannaea sp. PMI_226]
MAPESHSDEEEQYDSSQDSDFAPDAVADQDSEQSDSEEADQQSKKKRKVDADASAADDGYDNSGDETIIKKGEKRLKKSRAKGIHEDDEEGGEGGLIKTRRQRAAEKEERKYSANNGPVTVDVDALWAQMISGAPVVQSDKTEGQNENPEENPDDGKQADPSTMIRIKRTYNFAGRVHTEEKLVARDSAEAKLFLASQGEAAGEDESAKRVTRKAFRSAFEPFTDGLPQRSDLNLGMAARIQAGKEARAKKLNTVEKSRMDWAGFVDKEGIKDELELAGKSKDSYNAREEFLARSQARRDDESRRARVSQRA